MSVDVSVIIPVYNAAELLDRCLDSVFGQVGEYSIEVILVDDGSTDNSVELIKRRSEQDRIQLFQQENSGPSVARNKGIQEAKGKYLAFLDADDYWLSEFLDTTVSFLEQHHDVNAVSIAQRHLTPSGQSDSPFQWQNLSSSDGSVLSDFFAFWSVHNHICTGSILIKTCIAKQTGGMREDLRICEDLEYWARLSLYGRMAYIPKLLFVSDGAQVTNQIGWVQKNLPRWNSAVVVEEWEYKLQEISPDISLSLGYVKARGRIARNLAYSILCSKRFALAKSQIEKYGHSFPDDSMSKVLNIAVRNKFLWLLISRALVYREYHR